MIPTDRIGQGKRALCTAVTLYRHVLGSEDTSGIGAADFTVLFSKHLQVGNGIVADAAIRSCIYDDIIQFQLFLSRVVSDRT